MSSGAGASTKMPKTMSSRLLTMKFMQRAAAAPYPPPSTLDQPSPKRHKTGNSTSLNSAAEYLVDQHATLAALAEEESKRQSALERQAAEAGDTRWVLKFEDEDKISSSSDGDILRVIHTEFAAIDGSQGGSTTTALKVQRIESPAIEGRRSYGRFNRAIEKLRDPTTADSSDSESDSGSENASENSRDSDADDPASALIRYERENALKKLKTRKLKRKSKGEERETEVLQQAEKLKEKEMKINHLQSISSRSMSRNQACHKCGALGHLMAFCPQTKGRRNDGGGHFKRG